MVSLCNAFLSGMSIIVPTIFMSLLENYCGSSSGHLTSSRLVFVKTASSGSGIESNNMIAFDGVCRISNPLS